MLTARKKVEVVKQGKSNKQQVIQNHFYTRTCIMHFLSNSKTLMLSVLVSVVSFSSVNSMELIAPSSVSSSEPVQLFRNHKNLFVQDENAAYRVEKYNMNPLLHEAMERQALGDFTVKGGYLRVKSLSDGKYFLEARVRVDGGGLGGTTVGCYAGKFIVHFVAHGTIGIISSFTGPAAPATALSLEATFLPTIEAASNIGAIAGGIIGGLFTGPV